MFDRRRKDVNWAVAGEDGHVPTWEQVGVAVMMDIRDELKRLNSLLYCSNFTRIPMKLDAIRRNTTKRKRKKRGAHPGPQPAQLRRPTARLRGL